MIFLFWDKVNDELELLGEDGEFSFYSEDSVAIRQGDESGRYWCELEKLQDLTPLRDWKRFEIMDPETGEWVEWEEAPTSLIQQVQKHAGVKLWQEVS